MSVKHKEALLWIHIRDRGFQNTISFIIINTAENRGKYPKMKDESIYALLAFPGRSECIDKFHYLLYLISHCKILSRPASSSLCNVITAVRVA